MLAPWELGHWVNLVALRPSVASPHLPPRLLAQAKDPSCQRGLCRWIQFATAPDAAAALSVAKQTRSRYLLLGAMSPAKLGILRRLQGQPEAPYVRLEADTWQPLPGFWGLFYQRLMLLNGSAVNLRGAHLAAAGRLRLIAASSGTWARISGRAVPWYKVFEVLPAPAAGTGQVGPGQEVKAEVRLLNGLGRREAFRQRVVAGADGRFTLALPYAAHGASRPPPAGDGPGLSALTFVAVGPYLVRGGGRCGTVSVTEAQVRAGASVPVVWGTCPGSQAK